MHGQKCEHLGALIPTPRFVGGRSGYCRRAANGKFFCYHHPACVTYNASVHLYGALDYCLLWYNSALQVNELNKIGCDAQAVQCDVSNEQQQQEAFQMHMQQFRRLDIAILNAGIGDQGQFALFLQPTLYFDL